MTYLLDINVLLAAIWRDHAAHRAVDRWVNGKLIAVCPFTELGFLRISSHLKGPFKAPMAVCRAVLAEFLAQKKCAFLAADLPGLKSPSESSETVTDVYLAELAGSHGMVLATLDRRLRHPAAELI